ncbi:hypothetical protein NM688_g5398 [Phlebia brevispora]|uniref:Uncharacterized protein n=1 Tax=Phlebia brevispora TaxID=194682 RepID=A0ACC1SW08_9APHY|nr:hypothetical protein NM688_g5398 [Phlebia brevispora]
MYKIGIPSRVYGGSPTQHPKLLGPKTELWARASYAALLRRLGREAEAVNMIHVIRAYVMHHPYALPSEKYHRLLKDLEREFELTLLDATLSLETDVTLALDVGGEERLEIEHVEDVENDEDVSESDIEDNKLEDGFDVSEGPASSELSSSPPSSASSDTESSEESSVMSSPLTPALTHLPISILHVERHETVIENYTYNRDGWVEDDMSSTDAESGTTTPKDPVTDNVGEDEEVEDPGMLPVVDFRTT